MRERARCVGTYRAVRVYLMETLARWVPTTPELEAKVLFGRNLWDFAQHADALGRRALELRAPLHYSESPTAEFQRLLSELASAGITGERIVGLYDVILPSLAKEHQRYLDETDSLLDEPTVRVLERIALDDQRATRESRELMRELPELAPRDSIFPQRLSKALAGISDVVSREESSSLTPEGRT